MARMSGSRGHPSWGLLKEARIHAHRCFKIERGTEGAFEAPAGVRILPGAWADGVDALTTELGEGGAPSWVTPCDEEGRPITVEMDEVGNWRLSGVPTGTIGVVYYSWCPLVGCVHEGIVEMMVEE